MSAVLLVIYIPCDHEGQELEANGEEGGGADDKARKGSVPCLTDADTCLPCKQQTPHPEENSDDCVDEVDSSIQINLSHSKSGLDFEQPPAAEVTAKLIESSADDVNEVIIKAGTESVNEGLQKSPSGEELPLETKDEVGKDGEEQEQREEPIMMKKKSYPCTPEHCFENYSLEETLQNLFDDLGIWNDSWNQTFDRAGYQISFVVPTEECDVILRRLTLFGIGNIPDTSITIFPASFHHVPKPQENKDPEIDGPRKKSVPEESDFYKSIKSRLIVAQVVSSVENNAQATFDFIMLICLASFIAGLGLVENSSVVLVASMLISPLMGPILGGVFGTVIHNRKLTQVGVVNATIGLVLCLLVGFVFGLLISGANIRGTQWGSSDSWPTLEMASRGQTRSLWVGVLIALPSGAAVALSILGGNIGSLVGVAISASLLPPAVNAGMLWAYALVVAIKPPDVIEDTQVNMTPALINATLNGSAPYVTDSINGAVPTSAVPPNCPALLDNKYTFTYSCNMASEAAILGAVSLFLTLLNILCIFLMGILVLKIKEVAPHTTINDVFWKKDLPTARDYYKTIKGKESNDLRKMMKDISGEMKELEEQGELPDDAKKVRGPMVIRSQSHDGYTVVPGIHDHDDFTPASSYHTPPHFYPLRLRHTSQLINRDSIYFPEANGPYSPHYMTPPTSLPEKRFEFPVNGIRKRKSTKSHRDHGIERQSSMSTEMEKHIFNRLAEGPQKCGRFMVSSIPEEEDNKSLKGADQTPTVPVLTLKAPVKKTAKEKTATTPNTTTTTPSSTDSVVVNIGDGHVATSTL